MGISTTRSKDYCQKRYTAPPLTHIHTHTYIQAHKHTHIHIHTHAQTHRSHDEYSRGQNALCVSNTHLCWGEATVRGHSSISWPFDHYCTRSSRRRCHHVTQQNDVFTVHEVLYCGAGQYQLTQCLVEKKRDSLVSTCLNPVTGAENSWMQRRSRPFQLL